MIYVSGMERARQQKTKNLKGWSEGHFTILGMMILCVCVCVCSMERMNWSDVVYGGNVLNLKTKDHQLCSLWLGYVCMIVSSFGILCMVA